KGTNTCRDSAASTQQDDNSDHDSVSSVTTPGSQARPPVNVPAPHTPPSASTRQESAYLSLNSSTSSSTCTTCPTKANGPSSMNSWTMLPAMAGGRLMTMCCPTSSARTSAWNSTLPPSPHTNHYSSMDSCRRRSTHGHCFERYVSPSTRTRSNVLSKSVCGARTSSTAHRLSS